MINCNRSDRVYFTIIIVLFHNYAFSIKLSSPLSYTHLQLTIYMQCYCWARGGGWYNYYITGLTHNSNISRTIWTLWPFQTVSLSTINCIYLVGKRECHWSTSLISSVWFSNYSLSKIKATCTYTTVYIKYWIKKSRRRWLYRHFREM